MDKQYVTQKKFSQIYSGNLAYFRRSHYLRSLRAWGFLLAALLCVVSLFGYLMWGSQKAFSPGPISENHAFLTNDCRACHSGEAGDLLLHPEKAGELLSMVSLQGMDKACLECHPGTNLHSPQIAALSQLKGSGEIASVHASSCAACHREHTGHQRLALPANQACTQCHNDAERLQQSRTLLAQVLPPGSANPGASTKTALNADLGDGIMRFIAPGAGTDLSATFDSFSKGHPGFGYERPTATDPAELKFNHARHSRSDMPLVNNRKLECASCHQPEPNGAFYQPIRYEKHCQQCHSLQIQPSLPNLLIPHGDPEKVRLFLASMETSFSESFRLQGVRDPLELSAKVEAEKNLLRQRGLYSLQDLEKRVFLEGDPQDSGDGRLMRSGNPKFLTECAKCHTVDSPSSEHAPVVQSPNIARRWLQKGAFSHLPHQSEECASCHSGVTQSKLTSDILLPTQQSCTKCHFSIEDGRPGVKSACQSCHHFHGSVSATLPHKSDFQKSKATLPASQP